MCLSPFLWAPVGFLSIPSLPPQSRRVLRELKEQKRHAQAATTISAHWKGYRVKHTLWNLSHGHSGSSLVSLVWLHWPSFHTTVANTRAVMALHLLKRCLLHSPLHSLPFIWGWHCNSFICSLKNIGSAKSGQYKKPYPWNVRSLPSSLQQSDETMQERKFERGILFIFVLEVLHCISFITSPSACLPLYLSCMWLFISLPQCWQLFKIMQYAWLNLPSHPFPSSESMLEKGWGKRRVEMERVSKWVSKQSLQDTFILCLNQYCHGFL